MPDDSHEQPLSEVTPEPEATSESRNVLDLLRNLKQKSLSPAALSVHERHACVAHLSTEGVSVPEIAALLACSERTIARDRKAVREGRALNDDPKLAGEVAGELLYQGRVCVERIRRAIRARETPPSTQIDGERAVMEILDKMIHRLQTMGYLPSAAQQIEATLSHRLEDSMSLQEIYTEAKRVQCIESINGVPEKNSAKAPKGADTTESFRAKSSTGKESP